MYFQYINFLYNFKLIFYRLINSMGPKSPLPLRWKTNPWIIFMDHLPGKRFPEQSRRPFFEKKYSYTIQLHAATFAYINRVPSGILENTLKWHYQETFHITWIRKLHHLYQYWNDPHDGYTRRGRYFAYSIVHNKVLDLNLQVRQRDYRYFLH